ncbi:hypothetical protein [Methylobacterium ajmalii]|jgi:hypothetical protein|uniref:hypothetical protein n=1 Tax=Methylobacterium ajmalii TaxID=2738439 RepID=UPI00190D3F54|nr:hypothetical protein [Methylobacterium ajmalii]MBK3398073.1 hypothetical protein [Methylobacterium ajmalii]MBK3406895.1 hypothetical protein [Methylobacterium ajmalii]MBK3424542.1 hypothetical protein [Methylobacterium ajmalii]MBZ6416495.1 hypothetical protein [Methylobacterium sp.]
MSIDLVSDICDAVAAWEQAFVSEASLDRYRRACAWTASEVAKSASVGATSGIDRAFSNPTPWMSRAFGYTRALTRIGDVVSADFYTKPSQSIVLKYEMGDGPQIRRPGDVGLAQNRILVSNWRNLLLTQGITATLTETSPVGSSPMPGSMPPSARASRPTTRTRPSTSPSRSLGGPCSPPWL